MEVERIQNRKMMPGQVLYLTRLNEETQWFREAAPWKGCPKLLKQFEKEQRDNGRKYVERLS
jgi:hypothetical protein